MIENNLIKIVNAIIDSELKIVRKDFIPIESGEELLSSTGIDSLEYMVLYMWLGEIYGIDSKGFAKVEILGDITFAQLSIFIEKAKTKNPSVEEALDLYND
mgnify:CR=1 FL=1|jgi:hypothetical protein